MALMTRRSTSPLTEMMDWLETMTPFRPSGGVGFIPIEAFREDGNYVIRADLPGIDPEKDVTVTVGDGCLGIYVEGLEEQHERHHSEVRFGSFSRRVPLPKGCTEKDVKATYAAGVLTVSLPAAGEVPEPTRI